jgi:hypothetical protein
MPAPKKSTAKSTSTAKTATKPTATSAGNVAVAELPVKAAPVAKPTTSKTEATPKATKAAQTTQIVAQIDVGFGNRLTIRGSGAGLNWQSGQTLHWQNSAWVWSSNATEAFEFKVLLNDEVWAQGENLRATPGQKIVFKPQF